MFGEMYAVPPPVLTGRGTFFVGQRGGSERVRQAAAIGLRPDKAPAAMADYFAANW